MVRLFSSFQYLLTQKRLIDYPSAYGHEIGNILFRFTMQFIDDGVVNRNFNQRIFREWIREVLEYGPAIKFPDYEPIRFFPVERKGDGLFDQKGNRLAFTIGTELEDQHLKPRYCFEYGKSYLVVCSDEPGKNKYVKLIKSSQYPNKHRVYRWAIKLKEKRAHEP